MLEPKLLQSSGFYMIFALTLMKNDINASTVNGAQAENMSLRSVYFKSLQNKRLGDHAVKSLGCTSLLMCSHLCLRNAWCTSTNFKKSEKGTCELYMQKLSSIPGHKKLIDEQGVTFSMFLKVCLS